MLGLNKNSRNPNISSSASSFKDFSPKNITRIHSHGRKGHLPLSLSDFVSPRRSRSRDHWIRIAIEFTSEALSKAFFDTVVTSVRDKDWSADIDDESKLTIPTVLTEIGSGNREQTRTCRRCVVDPWWFCRCLVKSDTSWKWHSSRVVHYTSRRRLEGDQKRGEVSSLLRLADEVKWIRWNSTETWLKVSVH